MVINVQSDVSEVCPIQETANGNFYLKRSSKKINHESIWYRQPRYNF